MKISFIIPTYKKNQYLLDAINSINVLLGDFQREILVIHNGDERDYFSYLNSLSINNLVVCTTGMGGVSQARNYGIDMATGDYIVFLDDDDLLSNNYINEGLLLNNIKVKNHIVITNLRTFSYNGNLNESKIDYVGRGINKLSRKEGTNPFNFKKLLSSACFKIYPRDLIGTVRFNTRLSVSEDALFVFELSRKIDYYLVVDSVFYFRRTRQESVSNIKKGIRQSFEIFRNFVMELSKVYISDISSYSFLLYINRIGASFKFFIMNILK